MRGVHLHTTHIMRNTSSGTLHAKNYASLKVCLTPLSTIRSGWKTARGLDSTSNDANERKVCTYGKHPHRVVRALCNSIYTQYVCSSWATPASRANCVVNRKSCSTHNVWKIWRRRDCVRQQQHQLRCPRTAPCQCVKYKKSAANWFAAWDWDIGKQHNTQHIVYV